MALEQCVNPGRVCDVLEEHGFRPAWANSKRVRMIAEGWNKPNCIDSEFLAQMLRTGYLPLVHIPLRGAREARELVSYRATFGHRNNELKSRVPSILAKEWVEVPAPLFYNPETNLHETIQLAPLDRKMPDGHLEQLRVVAEEVTPCQVMMARRSLKDERVLRLMENRGSFPHEGNWRPGDIPLGLSRRFSRAAAGGYPGQPVLVPKEVSGDPTDLSRDAGAMPPRPLLPLRQPPLR